MSLHRPRSSSPLSLNLRLILLKIRLHLEKPPHDSQGVLMFGIQFNLIICSLHCLLFLHFISLLKFQKPDPSVRYVISKV